MTNAVVRASAGDRGADDDPADRFAAEIEEMSAASQAHYEALVTTDGFVEFFRRVTPIAQIGTLPIASRPVSRGVSDADGAGGPAGDPVGVRVESEQDQPDRLVRARRRDSKRSCTVVEGCGGCERWPREWPFFSTLLENAELSLAKTDLAIAEPYLARGARPDLSLRSARSSNARRRWS